MQPQIVTAPAMAAHAALAIAEDHSEEDLTRRLAAEHARGAAETESCLRGEYEGRSQHETARISKTIAEFEKTRKDYFAKVESEVVHLALAIAAKILHRESQVDPMLVAALVQIALGQLKEGSAATIRVRPDNAQRWHQHFASLSMKLSIEIVEDTELQPGDCILETELGSVNFSLDVQLKEVQQGFFDVLSHKPVL
ncbi:FliH/SctL family protein [Granulicella tundricola]|nr:FliH/SctL family protein [Granulicella tundricola]